MRLPPILSILWARRAVVAIPVVGALIGSSIAMALSPPRYVASARVVLNYIKPERDTGLFVNSKYADAYEKTQIDFLREPEVAGLAAEAMGWLDTPEMQEAYALRDPLDTRDMRTWIAARLVGDIGASMVDESNILEIRYTASSPEVASTVVGAIRDAYIQANTNQYRRSAMAKADANSARLEQTRARLAELEAQKTRLERASGQLVDAQGRDADSRRLDLMVTARIKRAPFVEGGVTSDQAEAMGKLAEVDATVASGARGLGPNHPEYQALLRQREQMRAAANDLSRGDGAIRDFFERQELARASLFEALKARILSQRDRVLQLRLVQDQINHERAMAEKLSQSAAEQRQRSVGEQTGLIPLGAPSEARRSIRNNTPLIISTAVAMGLLYGALLALLVEFLARQVRTPETLQVAAQSPVIGVVPRSRRHADRRPGKIPSKWAVRRDRKAPASV